VKCHSSATIAPAVAYTTDGSGWIPINFDGMTGGSPVGSIPTDPNKTTIATDPGRYYVYQVGSTSDYTFKLVANMESTYYTTGGGGDVETNDGGTDDQLYETGTDMAVPIVTETDTCYKGKSDGSAPTTTTVPPTTTTTTVFRKLWWHCS